jgi:hypothetical protein
MPAAEDHRIGDFSFSVLLDGSPYTGLLSNTPRLYVGDVSIIAGTAVGTQAKDKDGNAPTFVHVGDADAVHAGCYYASDVLMGGKYSVVAALEGSDRILYPYYKVAWGSAVPFSAVPSESPNGVLTTFTWDIIPYGDENYDYGVSMYANFAKIPQSALTVTRTATGGQVVVANLITAGFSRLATLQTGDKLEVCGAFLPGEQP